MRTVTIDKITDSDGVALTIETLLSDEQIETIVEEAFVMARRRGVCGFNRLKMFITDKIGKLE